MPTKVGRILGVTGIVAAVGAIGGALGGVLLAAVVGAVELVQREPFVLASGDNFLFVATFAAGAGAIAGTVLGPLYAWTLLRAAPLWRAVGETALAAAVGVGVLLTLPTMGITMSWPILGASTILTSLLAAGRLRLETRRRQLRSGAASAS